MSSTRRRHQKPSQTNALVRSLSPDCYIDLTVDSPVRTPIQTTINDYEDMPSVITISRTTTLHSAPMEFNSYVTGSHNNINNLQENFSNETVVIDDTDSFPVVSLNSSPQVHIKPSTSCLSCPICLEELLNTSITACTTKCGHIFCEICLKKATKTRKKCPMCLKAINIKECIRLHI